MFPTKPKNATVKNLKNSTHETRDALHDAANQAGRKVRSMYNAASDEVSHVGKIASKEIRNNPLRSTAIAVGIGALLGMILRPSKQKI